MVRLAMAFIAFSVLCQSAAQSADKTKKMLPPIIRVAKVKAMPAVFKASGRNKPIVLKSEKDAAKYFTKTELAKLTKQVNFKAQYLVVFAWRGSGQDRMNYNVAESFPEQIFFKYKPGRTRDLRPHVAIFALRANVKFRAGKRRK